MPKNCEISNLNFHKTLTPKFLPIEASRMSLFVTIFFNYVNFVKLRTIRNKTRNLLLNFLLMAPLPLHKPPRFLGDWAETSPRLLRQPFDGASTALRVRFDKSSKDCRRTVGEHPKDPRSSLLVGTSQFASGARDL